ncbi:MAG TPA: hypothetical protein VL358_09785 [Caulobacteraceae bacterium]|nr:hypothetical protein [Caulobacteraceae bacterium]
MAILFFAVVVAAFLFGLRLLGVVIGIGGHVVRRSDNPQAFDLGLMGVGFFSAMLIVLMAFAQCARGNSDAATKAYLKRLADGAAAAKTSQQQALPKSE